MPLNLFHNKIMKAYRFTILLILSITLGSVCGVVWGKETQWMKPFGDIFLNLMFTVVVPLVFFSISSAVASIENGKRLGKIMASMLTVFVITGVIASLIMIAGVIVFPPAKGLVLEMKAPENAESFSVSQQIVNALTVSDFSMLLSKKNMLALIVFSVLTGWTVSHTKEKGKAFGEFLKSGNEIFLQIIHYIMYYAPVGLFAYFAFLVGDLGPQLLGSMARAMALFYPLSVLYFFIAFSIYAFWAGGKNGFNRFWKYILPPSLVALATGSSMATIPSNLDAADKIGTPKDISELVIPIGATIHMEGSCLSAILKIAVLFGIFGKDFADPYTILTATGVAILSGTVMSGIPGGGFIGEILIVSLFGFPPEALPVITAIGTLVDPTATMVNAIGDNVAGMMVARIVEGKNWMEKPLNG